MTRSSTRNEAKRLDTLIALPLGRFRAEVDKLTREELAALEARLALHEVRQRWALGGHGIARHVARHELALLARRMGETRRALEARAASTQLRLLELDSAGDETPVTEALDEAA